MAMTVSAAEGALVIDLAVNTSAVLAVLLREARCDGVLESGAGRCLRTGVSAFRQRAPFQWPELWRLLFLCVGGTLQVPLLFIGNDFSNTDLEVTW